jgi:hypothetical protein
VFGLLAFISLKLDWLLITLVGVGLTGACDNSAATAHSAGGPRSPGPLCVCARTRSQLLTYHACPHPAYRTPPTATGSNLVGYMRCSSDAQKRLQASLAQGALTGLSYIPGALPALGSTMLAVIAGGAGVGGGGGAGARPVSAPAAVAAGTGARAPADPLTASPFASVGDEKVTI